MNIMGGQYDPFIATGGMALRFYTSIILQLSKKTGIAQSDELIGYNINVKVKKNKVGKPAGECSIQFLFNSGFSSEAGVIDIAEKAGVVTRTGNSFYYGDIKLGVGKNKARAFLEDNEIILQEILSRLQ
jgi:recombination protein RecA